MKMTTKDRIRQLQFAVRKLLREFDNKTSLEEVELILECELKFLGEVE